MLPLSFALVASALFAPLCLAIPQGVPVPVAEGDNGAPSAAACGSCYVVADVAGIVFATEPATQTNTIVTSILTGRNGSQSTVISTKTGEASFTFGTTGLLGQAPTNYEFIYSATVTINGATLVSPTAYAVFSAFSVTSTVDVDGTCVVVAGASSAVNPAFSVVQPSGVDEGAFALAAESAFIAHIGSLTCSAGGANVVTSNQVSVSVLTTTSTTTGALQLTLTPQAQLSTLTSATSTATPTPVTSTEITTIASSVATIIVVSTPTATIVPFKGAAAPSTSATGFQWFAVMACSMLAALTGTLLL